MQEHEPVNLARALDGLRPKEKVPNSARVLDGWIAQAERQIGSDGGRLGWLVASTVVTAALQLAVDEEDQPRFLLKGGTLLQHRLPGLSRSTTDLDGLVRGDLDEFIVKLDIVLARPWGPCTLRRGPVETMPKSSRARSSREPSSTGTVKCWGKNWQGKLGDGTTEDRLTPVAVSGLSRAAGVTAGQDHVCALLSDATVSCWGDNWYGQLGDGTSEDRRTPVSVIGLE